MNPEELNEIAKPGDVWRIYLMCGDVLETAKLTKEEVDAGMFRCPYHQLVWSNLVIKSELSTNCVDKKGEQKP